MAAKPKFKSADAPIESEPEWVKNGRAYAQSLAGQKVNEMTDQIGRLQKRITTLEVQLNAAEREIAQLRKQLREK